MGNTLDMMKGLALGAGLMYFLDPDKGPRRRSLLADQLNSVLTDTGNALEPALDDLSNRAQGAFYEARANLTDEDVSDRVLEHRVRAELGRHVSHPGSITVGAQQGRVTLSGPVLQHEVEGLLNALGKVDGVKELENRMTVYKARDDIPGLQGGDVPPAKAPQQWSPGVRLLMASAGGLVSAIGLKQGGILGSLFGAVGLTAVARAMTNIEAKRLVGVGAGHRAVDVQKTLNVDAPVETVFNFWDNFENFPRFMTHVKEVKELGNGNSHWMVEGPAGSTLSWNASVTQRIPNEVIAWTSDAGTPVQNAGIVNFTPNEEGGTQVNVRLSYNPPAGAAGHAVADLLGYDPKTLMNEDMMRLKSLIEEGKTTADGETVMRAEVEAQQ